METIYKLPTWAETTLVICVALMLTALAIWLAMNAIKNAVEAESKLQHKRRRSETQALNNWKTLYEEEKQKRLADVSDLINENARLVCENKRMKELLGKVKVADL